MSNVPDAKQTIGRALGRVPSGVYVLTSRHGDRDGAMLASWVQQAAFDPPCVSIAIARGRPVGEMIRTSGVLALSIIPQADTSLMKAFARGVSDEDPLAGHRLADVGAAAPVLSDALAWLEGRLLKVCEFGPDHELFIARVTGGDMLREGPAFAHQRGNGFHY